MLGVAGGTGGQGAGQFVTVRRLGWQFRLAVLVTCCNFIGVVGLLTQDSRIFVPAAGFALLFDFLASGRKLVWPFWKVVWLLPAALILGALQFGLQQIGTSLPVINGDLPAIDGTDWRILEPVSLVVIFNGLLGDYLNSMVAWSAEHDAQTARVRAASD